MRYPIFIGLVFLCLFSTQKGFAQTDNNPRFSIGLNGTYNLNSIIQEISFTKYQTYQEFQRALQFFAAYSLGKKWKIGLNLSHQEGDNDLSTIYFIEVNRSANQTQNNISYSDLLKGYRSTKLGLFSRFSILNIRKFQIEIEAQMSVAANYYSTKGEIPDISSSNTLAIELRPIATYEIGKGFALIAILPGRGFQRTNFHDFPSPTGMTWDFSSRRLRETDLNKALQEIFFGATFSF